MRTCSGSIGPCGRSISRCTASHLKQSVIAHRQEGSGGRKEPVDWGIVGPIFLFSALGGALFGYDIGATSGALPSLTSPELSGTDWCAYSVLVLILASGLHIWDAPDKMPYDAPRAAAPVHK
jgi:hypothetical protein